MNTRVAAILAAVLLLGADPTPTSAPSPAPIAVPSIPPGIGNVVQGILQKLAGDAVAPYALDPNHVRGNVTFFRRFDLQVQMPLNTYKQVHLHQGTIINPRGATLSDGQTVDVRGSANSDGSLNADEITILHG
jgi:hypothetical protein